MRCLAKNKSAEQARIYCNPIHLNPVGKQEKSNPNFTALGLLCSGSSLLESLSHTSLPARY